MTLPLHEMEELQDAMEVQAKGLQNSSIMTIITVGFAPLMTALTIYHILPLYVFKYLLLVRTIGITLFSLVPIYNLATMKGNDAVKEFLTRRESKTTPVLWLERVPEFSMKVVAFCLAAIIYRTSTEIAILLIFNEFYSMFSLYIFSQVNKILTTD
ncbi:MAG: hypothetical protein HC778_02215 [Chamaesiphon sp. CSU_1_12]|nr:hypothetical protein [Chamaesiphon sp. CSU_1_12]